MAAATTTIHMQWCAAAIASCPSTCTCRAVRRRPRRCCKASSSCRRRSSAPALLPMPEMIPSTDKISALAAAIEARLPNQLQRVPALPDEICYEVQPADLKQVCLALRDTPELKFEMLMDLAGVD